MSDKQPRYWFPAKRYGWGWGVPNCWQGWAVLALFTLILGVTIAFVDPATEMLLYLLLILANVAWLIGVCWWKGEPPEWRWGDD